MKTKTKIEMDISKMGAEINNANSSIEKTLKIILRAHGFAISRLSERIEKLEKKLNKNN